MNEWIRVSDQLPKTYRAVWINSEKVGVNDGFLIEPGCGFRKPDWQCGKFTVGDVTHWMPKKYPEAPEQPVDHFKCPALPGAGPTEKCIGCGHFYGDTGAPYCHGLFESEGICNFRGHFPETAKVERAAKDNCSCHLWDQLEAMRVNQHTKIADMLGEVQYALVEQWSKGARTEKCPAADRGVCYCCPLDPPGIDCLARKPVPKNQHQECVDTCLNWDAQKCSRCDACDGEDPCDDGPDRSFRIGLFEISLVGGVVYVRSAADGESLSLTASGMRDYPCKLFHWLNLRLP